MVKKNIKDSEFRSAQEILRTSSDAWSGLTFEDIQRASLESIERLSWVTENDGENSPK
jgi:hypothetical protein